MRTKRISLLVALVFLIGAMTLPMTAFAAGDKDTTPPTLTAVLDEETVKIVSSDDNSGVEAVYIDKTRVNSLVDGKASVSLKDYAGTDKKVSVYAVDYAGNRSDTVKFDNPYYKEPAPTEKPAAPTQASQSSTPATKPAAAPRQLLPAARAPAPKAAIPAVPIRERLRAAQTPRAAAPAVQEIPAHRNPPLPPSRMVLSPRREPGPCWTVQPARMGINSFTPLPPRPGMCSILSLTASVTTTTCIS